MAISFSYRPFSCAALQGRTLVIDFLDFVEQHLPRRLPQQLSRRVAKELLSHAVEKHNAVLAVELENRLSSALKQLPQTMAGVRDRLLGWLEYDDARAHCCNPIGSAAGMGLQCPYDTAEFTS